MNRLSYASIAAAAAALALPATAPAKPVWANFKARLDATQKVHWEEHIVTEGCGAQGKFRIDGGGNSMIRLRTPSPQLAVAQRVKDPREVTLTFRGRPDLPVTGSYRRRGMLGGTEIESGDKHKCGAGDQKWERDCGTRRYPRGASVQVQWVTPSNTQTGSTVSPLTPTLFVTGPYPDLPGGRPWNAFRNCPGFDLNGALGLIGYSVPVAGPGHFSLRQAFGKKKHITIRGHAKDTVDLAKLYPMSIISGTEIVTTVVDWTMRLTRVPGPGVESARLGPGAPHPRTAGGRSGR
jgi:hypothetical protein